MGSMIRATYEAPCDDENLVSLPVVLCATRKEYLLIGKGIDLPPSDATRRFAAHFCTDWTFFG